MAEINDLSNAEEMFFAKVRYTDLNINIVIR
jgi:hypothetical protein